MRFTAPFMIRKVQGHSMLPVLPPGTLVWGYRWFLRLKPHKVIIAEHGGREIVKRIERVQSDGLFLLGDHAEASTDSRQYGLVDRRAVRAVVVWPRTRRVLAQSAEAIRQTDSEV